MKKITLFATTLSILITQTGCFGSFGLVKKVYKFNDSVEDPFVKTILFYVLTIIPVYEVAGLLDVVLFNLIEFWTGSNPVAMEAGQYEEQLITYKGNTYKVIATQNQMNFQEIKGDELVDMGTLLFDTSDYSWNFQKGETTEKLLNYDLASNQVNFYGECELVSIDAASVEYMVSNKMNAEDTYACLTH